MKKLFLSSVIFIAVILTGGILWWINGISPVNPTETNKKTVTITKGESSRQVGSNLRSAGIIRDPFVFYLLVKFGGYDGKIQAGVFCLSPNDSSTEILSTITKESSCNVKIQVIEGERAAEIAEQLQKNFPSYDDSWREKIILQEGFLFPDTYSIPKNATVDQIINMMKENFNKKYALASQGTPDQNQDSVITIASLIQREGKTNDDMRYIASVLLNRLQLGMALQVDATIQYALGNSFNWWPLPTGTDLQLASPYNTYKASGLPPTPICNPGLAAIRAALHPAHTNYLYYFTDKKGVTHFANTLDEQNANINRFGL